MTATAFVEIRDHALWLKHIHGNKSLKNKLLDLEEGEAVHLQVDGVIGVWVKMSDGKDGRPTPGIKAIGPAKMHWHSLQERRGDIVTIFEVR
jgi:hypothetical protein